MPPKWLVWFGYVHLYAAQTAGTLARLAVGVKSGQALLLLLIVVVVVFVSCLLLLLLLLPLLFIALNERCVAGAAQEYLKYIRT